MFQSTPAHGGRRRCTDGVPQSRSFQSTPAHGGRPSMDAGSISANGFQSTPAHGGRPVGLGRFVGVVFVSIHARTRRATRVAEIYGRSSEFQSTPAHGGRPTYGLPPLPMSWFQSTPAHGGRLAGDVGELRGRVSIHARTRRATTGTTPAGQLWCFNPRPHTAGDSPTGSMATAPRSFNPRPHTAGDTARQ